MRFPRTLILFFVALFFSTAALTSCNKEDDSAIPTGNINAVIAFKLTQPTDSCWRRYIPHGFHVEFVDKDNSKVLMNNGTSENANLDYGQYPYGTYQIRVTGYVREGNICTNLDQSHSKIDTIQVFTLDAPTKQVTFNLTNK